MSTDRTTPRLTKGFTVIELLVIAPIVILTISAFIGVVVNMTGEVLASRGASIMTFDVQDTLARVEQDIKLSTTFLAETNVVDAAAQVVNSPQGYDDNDESFKNVYSATPTKSNVLILNTLATTGNPLAETSSLFYINNQPNNCNTQLSAITQNTPMTMNTVYFVRDAALWRRVVAPSNYNTAGCPVPPTLPWQQPSCNPVFMDNPANSALIAFCRAKDIKLVDGVQPSDFIVQYFNSGDATAASSIASDASQTAAVRSATLQSLTTAGVSITSSKSVAGRTISHSGSIRATRLDINASTIAPFIAEVTPPVPSGVTATFNSPGQITVSWNPNATSYTLQYDTTSAFSAPITINSITPSSRTVTGLNASPQYFFRVSATNSAGTSGYSTTANSWSTIATGLQGWWMFNGNATDSSGSSMNGTLVNAPTLATGQNGASNSAYNFNGVNQHITFPSGFANFSGGLTFSVWANPTTSGNFARFFDFGTGSASNNIVFNRNGTSTAIQFIVVNGASTVAVLSIPNVIDNGAWNQYVVTMTSTGIIVIYKNGSSIGSGSGTLPVNVTRTINYIARSNWVADAFYTGSMDDVRIYNRALSATEISQLFANGAR